MFKKKWVALFCVGLALQAAVAGAKPLTFEVKGGSQDEISFKSEAPVEVIAGSTHDVSGKIQLDDSFRFDARHPFHIRFEVDLTTLDTGIPLRNAHMRDNFLETGKYGKASFQAKSVKLSKKPDLRKAQTVTLQATGDFSLHGVTVQKTIPLTVDYTPGQNQQPGLVRVRGKFPVVLAEHGIKRPEALFVKLADTVYATVDVTGDATGKLQ